MANNTITLHFQPCGIAPASGYILSYRPAGSGGAYRESTNFFESPAIIVDTEDPLGTEYEGFLQSDCGGGKLGPEIPWNTGGGSVSDSESAGVSEGESESVGELPTTGDFRVTVLNKAIFNITSIAGLTNDLVYPTANGSQDGTWNNYYGGNITVAYNRNAVGVMRVFYDNIEQWEENTAIGNPGVKVITGLSVPVNGTYIRISHTPN